MACMWLWPGGHGGLAGLARPSWCLLCNCVGMLLFDLVGGALAEPVVVLCWKWNRDTDLDSVS